MSQLTKNIKLLESHSPTPLNPSFVWTHLFGRIEKEYINIRYLFEIDYSQEDYNYLIDLFSNHTDLKKALFEEKYLNRYFQYNPQQRIFFLLLLVGFIRYGEHATDDSYEFWKKFQRIVLQNSTDSEKFKIAVVNYFFRYMGDLENPLSGLFINSSQTKVSLELENKGDARYLNNLIFHAGLVTKDSLDEFISIISELKQIHDDSTAIEISDAYNIRNQKADSQYIDYLFELLRGNSILSEHIREFIVQAVALSRGNRDTVYDFELPSYIKEAIANRGKEGDEGDRVSIVSNQKKPFTAFLHTKEKKSKKDDPDAITVNFEDARTYVRGLKLKSTLEWKKLIKGKLEGHGMLPSFIPTDPNVVYKNTGWKSWADWLNDSVAWLPFFEARQFVRTLELANNDEWIDYCRGRFPDKFPKPDTIPNHPSIIYSTEWEGIKDWLGTNFRPFPEAREFVRSLGLNGQKGWQDYFTGKLTHLPPKPSDIPTNPSRYYKEEWKGVGDWTGTDRLRSFGEVSPWRDFEDAQEFVRSLGLKDSYEWQAYLKGDLKGKPAYPADIPNSPMYVYKDKWSGISDWLGSKK